MKGFFRMRIFFLAISLCFLVNTIHATKHTKRRRQFLGYMEKQTSYFGTYYVPNELFRKEYETLVNDDKFDEINCLIGEVKPRIENLALRTKNVRKLAHRKRQNSALDMLVGTILMGIGGYGINSLNDSSTFRDKILIGLSWAGIFGGGSYLYSGLRKLRKSVFFEEIVDDQLKRESALGEALARGYDISQGSTYESDDDGDSTDSD